MTTPHAEIRPLKQHRVTPTPGTAPVDTFSTREDGQALRVAATLAEAASTGTVDLAAIWRELMGGRRCIVDAFFAASRCYLVLAASTDATVTPITGRRLAIVQAVFSGERQKVVAIDLEVAAATVTHHTRQVLDALGIGSPASRIHPLLMLAARAALHDLDVSVRHATFAIREQQLCVIGALRPDELLPDGFPEAEQEVVRQLVEGSRHTEIAQSRGTSERTVANQVSAIFRRQQVSRRNELIQSLLSNLYLRALRATVSELPPPPAATIEPSAREAQPTRRSA